MPDLKSHLASLNAEPSPKVKKESAFKRSYAKFMLKGTLAIGIVALAGGIAYRAHRMLDADSGKNTANAGQIERKYVDSLKASHTILYNNSCEYKVPETFLPLLYIKDIDTLVSGAVGQDLLAELNIMKQGYTLKSDTNSPVVQLSKSGISVPSDKIVVEAKFLFSFLSKIRADFNGQFDRICGNKKLHGNNRCVLNMSDLPLPMSCGKTKSFIEHIHFLTRRSGRRH